MTHALNVSSKVYRKVWILQWKSYTNGQKSVDQCLNYRIQFQTHWSYPSRTTGIRENEILIHPTIAPFVGELMRNFIIEKVQAEKNSNGRDTKEKRLYDYITGSMRSREMRKKIEKKMKLDGLQRKEEAYIMKIWKERKELIKQWYNLDRNDQASIYAITYTIQTEQLPNFVEECNIEQGEDDRPGSIETESGGSDNSG